jgi:hypothetical protein
MSTIGGSPRLKALQASVARLEARRPRGVLPGRELALLEADWRTWLRSLFGAYVVADFGPHHEELWRWVWAIEAGSRPRPFIAIWPRGGGKSTSAELACAAVAARGLRPYSLYVSSTQIRADDHVANVGSMLESGTFARLYPAVGERSVTKYGHARGWRRNRLRTASGFTVDSLGLDVAARGAKVDEFRPGLIIVDDIDSGDDTPLMTAKKLQTLTHAILPAGAPDLAVLAIQNLVHRDSIFSQLADARADFLADRIISGPFPALRGMTYEQHGGRTVLTGGEPLWSGQDLARCQALVDDIGLRAFRVECQHEVALDPTGALWTRGDIERGRISRLPDGVQLQRIVVAIDPSATATGDEAGIVVAGLGSDQHGYVLADLSVQGSPATWAGAAVAAYHAYSADRIVAEANHGGEMIEHCLRTVEGGRQVPYTMLHASRGKLTRAEPVEALYERGLVHHVGHFTALEDELCGWVPGLASPNRLDALVWALTELMLGGGALPFGWLTGNSAFRQQVLGPQETDVGRDEVPPASAPPAAGTLPFRWTGKWAAADAQEHEGERWLDTVHGGLWRGD